MKETDGTTVFVPLLRPEYQYPIANRARGTLWGMDMKVVITDSTYPDVQIEREVLSSVGATVERVNVDTPEAVINTAENADALLNQHTEITKSVFEALDDLTVVGRYGIGVDNLDVTAATKYGVQVVNVPSYCEEEVATHALALLLTCARRVAHYDRRVRAGSWDWKDGRPIHDVGGKTLGLVGFGKIPETLVALTAGFNLEFIAYDPYRSAQDMDSQGVEKVGFDVLLDRADFVSIHTPLTDETHELFDAEAFNRLSNDTVIINTARGGIVNEQALVNALKRDEIAGAGLDVLADEPPGDSPLFARDDVVVTPHVAWYSEESLEAVRRGAAEGVATALHGERPDGLVNPGVMDK